MSREELTKILDFENNKPDEMATDWVLVSRGAAVRAMVAAYNRGVDAALEHLEVKKIDAWWKDNLRKRLRI